MAQVERGTEERKANKRAKAKEGRSRRADRAGTANWETVNWQALIALIIAFGDEGGAVRVGKTRDGGAWALGVYLDDDYATEYIRPNEDFDEALHEIAQAWLPENGLRFEEIFASIRPTLG